MKLLKSHFVFSRSQRNGIFLLAVIIIALQAVYWFWPLPNTSQLSKEDIERFQKHQQHIDSLKLASVDANKPRQYPFNPNFITDYKGYTLGMSNDEIDRLLKYRIQDKWINSKADFQRVTKVSDSLLNTFSHLFKFPEWVTNPKPRRNYSTPKPRSYSEKADLNTATAEALQSIYGIGKYYSKKIVEYRTSLNGFSDDIQLQDIDGLKPDVIKNIQGKFTVKTPQKIEKINVNTAKVTDLSELPNLNYEIARQIIKFREANGNFTDLKQLKSIADFPSEKFDRIQLYLAID